MNALKAAISTSVRDGSSWQELKRNFIRKIERDEVSDEDFAIIKRIVERRGRDAAKVAVTPVDTVQYCSSRPQTPEPSSDVRVCMKENNEGRMDPERDDLETTSAGTGLKHPDSNVPQTRGYGRNDEPSPTAICSLAWDRIRGETSLYPRNAWTRELSKLQRQHLIHRTPSPGSRATNPKVRIKAAEKTSSLTPEGTERSHRLGTRL